MKDILHDIARENFRHSGYITHPGRERRTPWSFTAPPRSPFLKTDAVLSALQRRERARLRTESKPPPSESFFRNLLNAFIR